MQNEITDNAPPATTPNPAPPAEATAAPASASSVPSKLESPDGMTAPSHSVSQDRTRRTRVTGQFIPEPVCARPDRVEESFAELDVPSHTIRLQYEIVLVGGREEVVRVKSQLVLPLALEVENLAQTDVSFPELFDQIIVRPLVTKFRSFLQKRFDAASQAEAERVAAAQPPPPPVPVGFTIPKPANGTEFLMPEINVKPPTPKMPGGFAQSSPRIGS